MRVAQNQLSDFEAIVASKMIAKDAVATPKNFLMVIQSERSLKFKISVMTV